MNEQLVYVGTYNEMSPEALEGREVSKGIYLLRLNLDTGILSPYKVQEGVRNPSFLTIDNKQEFLYAVNELSSAQGEESGFISSFQVDKGSGALTFVDQKPSKGFDPCHVTAARDGFVLLSNYSTGSVSVYTANSFGHLELTDFIEHIGSSINKDRQESAHAHSCIFGPDGSYLYVMDLGADKIFCYQLQENGKLIPIEQNHYHCEPGSGPRFGEFHKTMDRLYVINELASSVTVLSCSKEDGSLSHIQTISTLFSDNPDSTGADLHISPNGAFLYASNRGEDSIAAYSIDPSDGKLTHIESFSTHGLTPRNFAVDKTGKFLLAANQNSDTICVFCIDEATGIPSYVSEIKIPAPVCIHIV